MVINPSLFPVDETNADSNSFNLFQFALAQENSVNATEAEDETTDEAEDETTDEAEDETTDEAEDIQEDISVFVQESRNSFEQQREETRMVIKECRLSLIAAEPSERADIKKQCRENLNDIKKSYKELRSTYKESFKELRKSMDVAIREYKGLNIDNSDKSEALSEIKSNLKNNVELKKLMNYVNQCLRN
ncbi:MAG: hypothetical protein HC944_03500 [Nanoarchaeota archaeon]|nr:hypothetical protein [Nanoarchaeota archaeon]